MNVFELITIVVFYAHQICYNYIDKMDSGVSGIILVSVLSPEGIS